MLIKANGYRFGSITMCVGQEATTKSIHRRLTQIHTKKKMIFRLNLVDTIYYHFNLVDSVFSVQML